MSNFSMNFFAADSLIENIEEFFAAKIDEYYRLTKAAEKLKTDEELLHETLLRDLPIIIPNIGGQVLRAVAKAIRPAHRVGPPFRGRPQIYAPERRDTKHVREFKVWLMNKLVAFSIGVPFDEEPPPLSCLADDLTPVETLSQMQRFEALSGVTLPHVYWVTYTRDNRTALRDDDQFWHLARSIAVQHNVTLTEDWREENKLCMKFEEYSRLRRHPELSAAIRESLAFSAQPRYARNFSEAVEKELLSRRMRASEAHRQKKLLEQVMYETQAQANASSVKDFRNSCRAVA